MIKFLFRQTAKNQRKRKFSNYSQRQLEDFQSRVQENQPPAWSSSTRQIENEVNAQLKVFQSYVRDIKEASLRLEELSKMLKSGEISENIYKLLLDELSSNLSLSVEQIFKIREVLEVLKAKAKIEWAREKIKIKQFEEQISESRNIFREDSLVREVYSPIYRWQEIINRIDEALSSLTFEEELSLIERYLSIVKERASPSKEIEEAKTICQQRLSALSEKWSSMRREKIGRIMDLELQASQIRDNIKEVEVRFAVGEMDRNIYESKISALQSSLRKIEREISEIRNYIDEIDLKIFRSSELLREI